MAEQDEGTGDRGAGAPRPADAHADLLWDRSPATAEAVARFFARTIGGDARYISHGEIQGGLSDDGVAWRDDLEDRFVEDLRDPGADTGLLVARAADGALAGAAIVEWHVTRRTRFAILADLSIQPARRSAGLGARMVAEIECEARRRDMQWIFLESGKDNLRAHAFFERHAFHEISHVFGKALA